MAVCSMLHQDLATANRHIAEGQVQVSQQARLVRALDADGYDTRNAQNLLMIMRRNLDVMNTHREYILGELSRAAR